MSIFNKNSNTSYDLMKESYYELKNIRSLTMLSLFVALNIVVGTLYVYIMPTIRLQFTFIVVGLCAMYFGPIATGCVGIVADILKYIIRPDGVFFIGFTFNEFLSGFIMGIILYKKPITVKRVFLARFIVSVLINIILTPIWMAIISGKAVLWYTSARIIKNLVLLPVETAILYGTLEMARKVKIKREVLR